MPTQAQLDEATYIAGVNAGGTIATTAYWGWNGATPAGYASGYTDARKWGANTAQTGATVSYYFDTHAAWTAAEMQTFRTAFALWSAVANVSFNETTVSDGANITLYRGHDGSATTTATAVDTSGSGGRTGGSYFLTLQSATVSIDTNTFALTGASGPMTALHEIGHAIGLGHAGPYNNAVTPQTQQNGAYDNTAWTVMSYISAADTTAPGYSASAATNWKGAEPQSFMPLDILAIQNIYGVAQNTPLSGGQVFGFNSNIGGALAPVFDFTQNTTPVVTLWDKGQGNTLDVSGFSAAATVNLNPGTFSSVDGLTNNIAVAFNTAIDTLVCGNGATTVTCNDDGDVVVGGSGNDNITGGAGNDLINAGAGHNSINGGGGTNTAMFAGPRSAYTVVSNGDGSTTVSGIGLVDTLTNIQNLRFLGSADDFAGSGESAILWQNDSGQAAVWTMNGFVQTGGSPVGSNPGPAWHVVGSGDFFGDGTADILWQNDDGSTVVWTMNGTTQTGSSYVGANPGSSWHVKSVADFNGDGKADILWQNDNGQAAIWTMDGYSVLAGSPVGGNPGTSWHIVGTGDFNGDGKADIVWQNDNGQAAIWTMDGFNQTGSYFVGGNPGTTWHIKGVGDFYGTGQSDLLWQNDSGQAAIWTMNGTTQTGSAFIGGNPGPTWHIVGTGDYNSDGKSDILWQNDNGQAAIWTMNGVTQLGGSLVGGNPGTTWHIPAGVG